MLLSTYDITKSDGYYRQPYDKFKNADQRSPGPTRMVSHETNMPERHELFLLTEGMKKVTAKPVPGSPNTTLFVFEKEDHTLGELLRAHLAKKEAVTFVGYKVPHPLEARFELRLQTDDTTNPTDELVKCCQQLILDLAHLKNNFTREFELKKIAQEGQ